MCNVKSEIQFFEYLINKLHAIIGDMYIRHTIIAKMLSKIHMATDNALLSFRTHISTYFVKWSMAVMT